MTQSTIKGYCSGMPLLVFDEVRQLYYWELVIGAYFDENGVKKVVTHRYWRGEPLYSENFITGDKEPFCKTYTQKVLEYLTYTDEGFYFAKRGEIPPIVYYLN